MAESAPDENVGLIVEVKHVNEEDNHEEEDNQEEVESDNNDNDKSDIASTSFGSKRSSKRRQTPKDYTSIAMLSNENIHDVSDLTIEEQQRIIDSRVLQLLDLSDFEDDEDLYSKPLEHNFETNQSINTYALMQDAYQKSTKIPPGMKMLPRKRYMGIKEQVEELLKCTQPLNRIPIGNKEGMFCIINNKNEPFTQRSSVVIYDDSGKWETTSHTSQYHIVFDDGDFRLTFRYKGKYCKRQADKGLYEQLVPQPSEDQIMILTRIYQRFEGNPNRLRRFCRLTKIPKNFDSTLKHCSMLDVVEYTRKIW